MAPLFFPLAVERHRDIDDELRFHFETRIEELMAQGLSGPDARARTADEFGDVGAVREGLASIDRRARRARARTERLRDIAGDLAYAVRSLRRTPGFAFAILATLALGVGANAAMFTLIDSLFLRPPAGVVAPAGVRRIWVERKYRDGVQFSQIMAYWQYKGVAAALGDRAGVTVYRLPGKTKLGAGESSVEAQVSYAPASYFSLLGVRAMLGRFYSGDEDLISRPADVAVVSEAYWRRELHGDSSVIGTSLEIAPYKYTVIGVAGGAFAGTELDAADVWLPLGSWSRGRRGPIPWYEDKRSNGLFVLVRPAAAARDGEIEQRVQAALRRPGMDYTGDTSAVVRLGSIVAANGPGKKAQETEIVVRLAGVAGIVLLIACANVTNLLLARAVRRRREIAVRLALGISRGRLIRLLLAESAVLAAAAAVVSILVAYWGGALLRALLFPDVHWAQSPLNWSIVLFAAGVSLAAGLLAGIVPAMHAASPELTSALKSGGGAGAVRQSALRAALVVAQSALSVVLLVGAMLFVRSLTNVRGLDLGWDARRLLTATVRFDGRGPGSDAAFGQRLRELADQMATLPGVEHTAFAHIDPMGGFSTLSYFTDTDSLGSRPRWMPTMTAVSSGYFAATGLRILRGSDFPKPGAGAAAGADIIVSEAMAKGLWPGADPVGQCMHLGTRASPCYPIRGVASDSRTFGIIEDPEPRYYLSLDALPPEARDYSAGYVVARVAPERGAAVSADVRALIRRDFPGGIPRVTRLSDSLEPQYRPWRLGATLFTIFGILSLIIAAIGMYSTVAYAVGNRLHEFGVRIALGARMGNVLRLVVADGLKIVAGGIAIGLALAVAGGRFIAALLYGIAPRDPAVMTFVAVLLLVVAVAASLVPAWRAARVDPVTALRAD